MTNKNNSLSTYRKSANIPLTDVAFLLNMDIGNLSKIEKGIRNPNPRIIMLYHILFKAPLLELFDEQYESFQVQLKRRSRTLVERLYIEQAPKSKNRIVFIDRFVKTLNNENYER